jgi:predicted methyltransferase
MIKILGILVFLLNVTSVGANNDSVSLQQVISGKQRSSEHKARDKYRHPQQTLEFFEVRENMTVVEIWPGEGWYTEILAPFLRNKGKLIAAHFSPDSSQPYYKKGVENFIKKLHKQPKVFDKVELTVLQPTDLMAIAPAESVDRVLTFRNVHNWMKNDQAYLVFKAMYNALKPGGILGVVEHRNNSLKSQDVNAESGYLSEDYVIALARNVGFEFLGKSEINSNSKDTKDYPEGVWTLPPTLVLGDKSRNKYLEIGESDRMTIKFIKPANSLFIGNNLSH